MSNIQVHSIWDQRVGDIKSIFAPKFTNEEFMVFVQIGKSKWLDPFNKEIFAVKYGWAAQIFIGKNGYVRIAQSHPDYKWHTSEVVYENDDFVVENWYPKHKYGLKDRWAILWAYCLLYKNWMPNPILHLVSYKEYRSGTNPVWKDKPETMIKKVAVAQALRESFYELFAWTYDESEMWTGSENNTVEIQVEPSEKQFLAKQIFDEYYDIKNEKNPTEYSAHLKQWKLSKILKSLYNKQSINELTEAECSDFVINIQDKMSELFTKVEVEV